MNKNKTAQEKELRKAAYAKKYYEANKAELLKKDMLRYEKIKNDPAYKARAKEASRRSYLRNRDRLLAKVRKHPYLHVYKAIKERCLCKTNKQYLYYGGRGITICQRWLDSYENFVADMGERPPGTTIERIDNNGNYEPANCRWATAKEQSNNRRSNTHLEFNNKKLTVAQWADEMGCDRGVLLGRIKAGWSIEHTLTLPTKRGFRHDRQ